MEGRAIYFARLFYFCRARTIQNTSTWIACMGIFTPLNLLFAYWPVQYGNWSASLNFGNCN